MGFFHVFHRYVYPRSPTGHDKIVGDPPTILTMLWIQKLNAGLPIEVKIDPGSDWQWELGDKANNCPEMPLKALKIAWI